MNLPSDVANQALDAIGYETAIGDLEEGTRPAQVLLRAYGQCLRQLLRAAHWDFARRTVPMVLLADATGQTADVGTLVPVPWTYEYEYPIDCAKVRFIPWNPALQTPAVPAVNIQPPNPNSPVVTGMGQAPLSGQRIVPARFTVATDPNYPVPAGTIFWEVQGVSPQGRTVILTNVQNAQLVYTAQMLYPSVWDPQFRAAMVAYLASEVALPLSKDRKFGLTLRTQQIELAKQKIKAARTTDGNEGYYSSDIRVDWMQARNVGGAWGPNAYGDQGYPGVLGYGWDSCGFSDGSAF